MTITYLVSTWASSNVGRNITEDANSEVGGMHIEQASVLSDIPSPNSCKSKFDNDFYKKCKYTETPVFPLGIAALQRRNPGEKMVAGSIPLKGHFWELLNRLLNFWCWSDEFEKQTRTRKVTSTVRGYLYPVHRTPTDDPIYGGGNGQGEGR